MKLVRFGEDEPRKPLTVYAAINPNEEIRRKSSSGGIFTMLAESILDEGGVVFGARFNERWEVVHDYTETKEGLAFFRGSKYVQSSVGETYQQAKTFLSQGRKVMYTGTPCQIAGLKQFLGKEYDSLLSVDVACHGVPSPRIWATYLELLREKLSITDSQILLSELKQLKFNVFYRKKENVLELRSKRHENDYMKSFIYSLILRPSCYDCKMKNFRSSSDLTIADFWGVENIKPDYDDGKGTNLVIVNTQVGEDKLNSLSTTKANVNMQVSIAANPALTVSSPRPKTYIFDVDANNLIPKLRYGLQKHVQSKRSFRQFLKSIYRFLRIVLKKQDENTILIMHGWNFKKILKENHIMNIISIDFRNKTYGWRDYGMSFFIQLKKIE